MIRPATLDDLNSILEIYNEAVLTTTATFDTDIKTLDNRREWFLNRNENFPVIVAEYEGVVAGYASLNKWSDKKAYDITAENSVYVYSPYRGKGIGKELLKEIIALAFQTNLHSIISRITEENKQSVKMHVDQGFQVIGTMKEAGRKFDRLLSVVFLQKMLKHQ